MGSEMFGFDQLKAKLQAIADAKHSAFRAAGVALLKYAQDQIINGGSGWPAWSAAYAKVAAKRPHQMLWESGTLLRSLTLGGPNNVFDEEGDDTIILGSNVIYAARQQFGGGGIPARAYFMVDETAMSFARDAFIAQLARSLK